MEFTKVIIEDKEYLFDFTMHSILLYAQSVGSKVSFFQFLDRLDMRQGDWNEVLGFFKMSHDRACLKNKIDGKDRLKDYEITNFWLAINKEFQNTLLATITAFSPNGSDVEGEKK